MDILALLCIQLLHAQRRSVGRLVCDAAVLDKLVMAVIAQNESYAALQSLHVSQLEALAISYDNEPSLRASLIEVLQTRGPVPLGTLRKKLFLTPSQLEHPSTITHFLGDWFPHAERLLIDTRERIILPLRTIEGECILTLWIENTCFKAFCAARMTF